MKKRIKLNTREKGVLLFEGIGAFLLFQIMNVFLISMIGKSDFIQNFQTNWHNLLADNLWKVMVVLVLQLILSYFWVITQYHRLELRQIKRILQQSATANLPKPIKVKVDHNLQDIIDSFNLLIDNMNRRSKEQEKSEKSKDELISNVSHDIRTPLTSVIGYLGLIESKNYNDLGQILKYTHIAYKKSLEMQNLVNSLFEFANVQHATSRLNMTKFDMAQMLDQLSADFELEANKRGMEIIVNSDPDKIMMQGDTEKLGRVFNNLIMNAFKYGKGATHIWLTAEQKEKEVVVTVANNGQSIPKDSLDHVFDRFYRVEDSRSKKTGGTGLGLAIAQSMVKLHGGTIAVTSDKDRTSFISHFPIV
ncbi:sensor histidine kinase [Companilactobacillus alimentarius]|uniref:histidine kinase n=2 Tax=Companilactobacillus alimentarius TaxID=1602 RepID=A0A2K9HQX8_9LACO|nr:HAMP domain-containing sensor histidine kinase [Companilactobacillus alimentarius]AUI72122.1 two-component sensor histidine kinase [Companilactobacillus alimentarius DSM 20249]MDT6952660.1 HAMP domain-containing sensor histidine kinase [Companilactobacillus alimentarius]GEO44900.1 two-component sensor histidine kinase [Companilactobacillus alimentarius]